MEFFDQAIAKLLQVAPELGQMILNFSDITEEVGNTNSQVGVFILRTGEGIAYCPVVGNGGSVFPIDSIFLDSEKRFVPLTRALIRRLQVSTSGAIGKVEKVPNSVPRSPDVTALVTPPRTGKFVYASSSRLVEFLAAMPKALRTATLEKFASEASVFDALDKNFGLKAIISVLKGPEGTPSNSTNNATNTQVSVLTSAQEVKQLMDEALTKTFLSDGFVVVGNPSFSRTAVAVNSFNKQGTYRSVDPQYDGGADYTVAMDDGSTKEAFLPCYHDLSAYASSHPAAIFEDGTWASGPMIAVGDPHAGKSVMEELSRRSPPVLLRDLFIDDWFMMFTSAGEAIGPFRANQVVLTNAGVEIKIGGSTKLRRIVGANNLTYEAKMIGDTLFVQHNVLVFKLGENISSSLETNAFVAQEKRELITSQFLGAEMDLRHDGIEFYANRDSIGAFPDALKYLVEKESLEPTVAQSFLKQAQEDTFVKVYLSKQASSEMATTTDIPTYGVAPVEPGDVGLNGAFMPTVNDAAAVGDGQILEATILSQLLQEPDLHSLIQEYLPEIQTAVDRLGRILFLSRVRIDQLATPMDSDAVFGFIAQLKGVYRTLGDATLKLEETSNANLGYETPEGEQVANKV